MAKRTARRRKRTSTKRRTWRKKNPNELSPRAEKLIRELEHDCEKMAKKMRRAQSMMRAETAAYDMLHRAAALLDRLPEELSMTLDAYAD